MRVTDAIPDRELVEALREQQGAKVLELSRRPYRYATSAPLEEVHVAMDGGAGLDLILKDLRRERLIGDARTTKPAFLHEPGREVETYRRILAPAGIGPRCVAAVAEADPPRHWLLLEKVPGVELWQVGELSVWEEVARWLGRFHARFSASLEELYEANPYLLEHTEEWYRSWCERARSALESSQDVRAEPLRETLDRHQGATSPLAALPRTFRASDSLLDAFS